MQERNICMKCGELIDFFNYGSEIIEYCPICDLEGDDD